MMEIRRPSLISMLIAIGALGLIAYTFLGRGPL